ncbi:MAG TPA: hypothetical protein VFP68_10520 [Burkholderiaceae bacterium]|nr:hypothetical protein [Burkholderiaceae bacterium]
MSESITPSFIQHVQNVAGVEREHWPDQFLQWYEPGQWLNAERAMAVFLGQKFAQQRTQLEGERKVLLELMDKMWEQLNFTLITTEFEHADEERALLDLLTQAGAAMKACQEQQAAKLSKPQIHSKGTEAP